MGFFGKSGVKAWNDHLDWTSSQKELRIEKLLTNLNLGFKAKK
jgi:hypothetical protein